MVTDTQITTAVKSDISWLKAHETIFIVLMFLLVGVYSINKFLDHESAKDAQAATLAAQQLTEARQEAATAASAYQAALTVAQQENAALTTAISQRQTVLVQQQTAIKTLPLSAVGQGIQTAIGGTGDITTEVDGLKLNDSASRRALSLLDEIPVLQADQTDLNSQLKNETDALTAAQSVIVNQTKELTADDASCKAQIASIKATARKKEWHWLIVGYLGGLATRGVVKLTTGL
jgi:hypothetical protein